MNDMRRATLTPKRRTSLQQPAKDLSAGLLAALSEEVKRRRVEQWLEENKASLDAYNAYVKKHGVFSDDLRGF